MIGADVEATTAEQLGGTGDGAFADQRTVDAADAVACSREVQVGDVAEAHDRLRIGGQSGPVDEGWKPVRTGASSAGDDGSDARVGDGVVEILGPGPVGAGHVAVPVTDMVPEVHLEAERADRLEQPVDRRLGPAGRRQHPDQVAWPKGGPGPDLARRHLGESDLEAVTTIARV